MNRTLRSPLFTYAAAIILTAVAFGLTQASPLKNGSPFLLFVVAVILSAGYGGLGPGLVSGLLGTLAIAYFFLPPINTFAIENTDDVLRLAVYVLVALGVSWLTAAREQAKEIARAQAQQQAAVANLGQCALASRDLSRLFDDATTMLCTTLGTEYSNVLELMPDGKLLLLRAGSGWREGLVGNATMDVGTDSQADYALTRSEPVVVQDLRTEKRFSGLPWLTEHNVISGMSVVIQEGSRPFGVMGVHTKKRRQFTDDDARFLQAMATILATAIERTGSEVQVSEQREWLRVILSSIGDGVIVTDARGTTTFINSVAASLTGWDQAQAISRQVDEIFQIVNDKTNEPTENPVRRAIQTGSVVKLSNYAALLSREGKRIPIDDSAAPIRNRDGQLIGAVLIFRDITARRQNEQTIRRSEERFRVALKNSPVVVFNQDHDLHYTWVYNQGDGFPNDSDVGKADADLMSVADAARLVQVKRGVLESGIGTREEITVTLGGQPRTFDLTIEPLHDTEGNVVGITCASIDITERKREQAAIARLAAIVESSNDAIVGKTLDGIILSWNPGAERLYGYAADEIIGQSVSSLYPPDRMDEFREVTEQLKRGHPIDQYDTVRVRKDGKRIDVSLSVSLVRDGMGRVIGASTIARDITERKRSEELQRFRAEASDVLGSSLDYETTLASIARLAVPRVADWCTVHVLSEDRTLQQLALAQVDPAQVERAEELVRRYPPDPNAPRGVPNVIRTGRPEFVERVTEEQIVAAARDPEHLKILLDVGLKSYMIVPLIVRKRTFGAISFILAESGRHYTPEDLALAQDLADRAALSVDNARLFRDLQKANEELEQRVVRRTIELQAANQKLHDEIVERQRATEQLRRLSAHLQSAREEERIRIAREIHDELGQVLTAIKIDLSLLGDKVADKGYKLQRETLVGEINSTIQLIDETIQKMRQIIRELRPEILDHLGLGAAIEWQVQEFQTRTGIECRFSSSVDDSHLDLDRSTAVFRILQEALTNVARHAQATRVEIILKEEQGSLVLEVRDNGRGITESERSDTKSFGILGMQERALAFGGQTKVGAAPGEGTTVTAWIPIG